MLTPKNSGWIEVICGPMFSGKTEELIRRLIRSQYAKQKVAIFKPFTDKRYSDDYIVSHNKRRIKSISVNSSAIDLTTLNPTGFPYMTVPINFNCFPSKNWCSPES